MESNHLKTQILYRPVGPKELEIFNQNIVGKIEVIADFYADEP
jgi:hypothetical protein